MLRIKYYRSPLIKQIFNQNYNKNIHFHNTNSVLNKNLLFKQKNCIGSLFGKKEQKIIELPKVLQDHIEFDPTYKFPNPANDFVIEGKEKLVGSWLLFAAGSVLFIIIVGGYTRLTKSGLSMVEWKPLSIKYPQNDEEWNKEFMNYQQYPEYKMANQHMKLEEFKYIFFWEWFHRNIARSIGIIFVGPLAYFLSRGYLKPKFQKRMLGLLLFGGLQGFIGWWMVKSGLGEKPDYHAKPRVSTYRLGVHLSAAIIIYSLLLWNAMNLLRNPQSQYLCPNSLKGTLQIRKMGILLIHFIAFNLISGVTVAGIDAGRVYNTWPLMNGQIIPKNYFQKSPFWTNFFENCATVQFNHRIFAYLTYAVALQIFMKQKKIVLPKNVSQSVKLMFLLVNIQVLDGIMTLLHLAPPGLSSLHQFGGIMTLSSVLYMIHCSRKPHLLYNSYLQKFIK